MVTFVDDDLVRTHDEALDLLRECAGGLRVVIEKTRDESAIAKTRRFVLTHPSHPKIPLSRADVYSLPFVASMVAKRVRDLAAGAVQDSATRILRT